ncbi:20538_t:CDS:2, partial [Funneliformis geosporum]
MDSNHPTRTFTNTDDTLVVALVVIVVVVDVTVKSVGAAIPFFAALPAFFVDYCKEISNAYRLLVSEVTFAIITSNRNSSSNRHPRR